MHAPQLLIAIQMFLFLVLYRMGNPGDQPQYHFHTQSSHINSRASGILLLSSPSSVGGNSIGDLVNLGESAEWIFQSIGQSRGENPRSWHESQSCQLRHSTTPSGTGTNHKGLVQSYLEFSMENEHL